jgi:hypothetical protein
MDVGFAKTLKILAKMRREILMLAPYRQKYFRWLPLRVLLYLAQMPERFTTCKAKPIRKIASKVA